MRQLRFITEIAYNVKNVMEAKESFERANPDVRVVVEQAEDSYELLQAYKSEEAPDLIETGGYPVGNRNGMVIDLNPYVDEIEGLEEDIYPGLLRVARYDGTLPGLPVEVSPPLIMYNKEMFERAGLAYPSEDWTWNDMIELAKRLTLRDEGGLAKQFGFGLGVDIEWFEPFVMRNGGKYISPDGTTSRGYVDSPATLDAFRKIVEAFRVHRVVRLPEEPAATEKWPDEAAMNFAFAWDAGHYRLKSGRYGVVGLPHMSGGQEANMIYMGGAAITNKSANPRLAWDFLRHYVLERDSWMPPISKSQAERRGLTAHPIWSRYLKELDYVQISGFIQNHKWNASRQLINEDIQRMIREGVDVAQTMRSWTRFT